MKEGSLVECETLSASCKHEVLGLEQSSLLPGFYLGFSHGETSLQLNVVFVDNGILGMLEGKDYPVADMVFLTVFGFNHRATGYTTPPKMTKVHLMYSSESIKVVACSWKRGWTAKELSAIETCWMGDSMTLVSVAQRRTLMKMYSVSARLCHVLHQKQRLMKGPSSIDND